MVVYLFCRSLCYALAGVWTEFSNGPGRSKKCKITLYVNVTRLMKRKTTIIATDRRIWSQWTYSIIEQSETVSGLKRV